MCTAHRSLAGGDAQGDCALRRRSIGWVMCDTRRFVCGASGQYLPTSREVCLPQNPCQFSTSPLNCFPGHPHTISVDIGTETGASILPRLVRDVFSCNLANPSHPSILQPNTSASVISPLSSSLRCVPRFSDLSHGSIPNLINGLAWAEREHRPSLSAHHASEERRPFSDGTFPAP